MQQCRQCDQTGRMQLSTAELVCLSMPACLAGRSEPEPKLGLAAASGLCFLAGDPVVSVSLESGCCSATSGHPAVAQAARKTVT